ncbi:Di-copper centre-containing protein [Lepidopterella palustris CBS 459.81]|uniref:Di-copper centre-containing protein n=1 Tax=Lepidopterella palustris CBS 459.81 TaxID=1314670 RepID=A0A8E2EJQ3_9PEZI|nr:Di-copper centre-containing protein [Lepidopterella palustris CBS 459.81]
MHFASQSSILTLFLAWFTAVSAVPSPRNACSNVSVRKEWRTLSNADKLSYIAAVKCLQGKPATTASDFSGVRTRFDDFLATHINNTNYIHFVGHFQPWHRWFVLQYEKALQTTCGYTGAQPMLINIRLLDWSQDASEELFPNSPVFDASFGFGGNGPYIDSSNDTSVKVHIPGKTGGGCVENGPFMNMSVNMGPGLSLTYNPRCLTRDLSPYFASLKLNSTVVTTALSGQTFRDFDVYVQGTVTTDGMTYHGGGHLSVGGDLGVVGDVYASPGDPLFYLHHANMDRLWAKWEAVDPEKRLCDISGPDTQFAYPFNFFGDIPYKNVTLAYDMFFGNLVPGMTWVPIRDVMDISTLCYTYA